MNVSVPFQTAAIRPGRSRVLAVLIGVLLLLTALPVAVPSLGAGAAATTPPFTPPAWWATNCDTRRPAGKGLPVGVDCRWLRLDGVWRRYVVVVPASVGADPITPRPLVLMLHGLRGTGEKMTQITDWIDVGARAGVITVFPTAWNYRWSGGAVMTAWNTYGLGGKVDGDNRLDGYPQDSPYPARDIEFLRRIIADVSGVLPVDPARIHVSGSSNGGIFMARVAVEMADVVASISASGFGDPPPQSVWDQITRPVPVLYGMGTADEHILRRLADDVDPDPSVVPTAWADAQPMMSYLVDDYLDALRLDNQPTKVRELATRTVVTWTTPRPKGSENAAYRLVMFPGAHHQYATWAKNPTGQSMARLSWSWFRAHPMP